MTRPLQPMTDDENQEVKRCSHKQTNNAEERETCEDKGEIKEIHEKAPTFLKFDKEDVDLQPNEKEANDFGELEFSEMQTYPKEDVESQVSDPPKIWHRKRVKSFFILGLNMMRVAFITTLRMFSILLMYSRNGIHSPKGRKRREFYMSEHFNQRNIRYYVNSFFMEMCNKKFRYFSLKTLFTGIRFPKFHIPSIFTVYPAYTLGEYYREIESNPRMTFKERMQYDMLRTSTFSKFPTNSPVSTLMLSKAGFYYEGNADEVVCFKCDVKHRNWKHLDNPALIHREISPSCPFVSNLENGNPVNNAATASNRNGNNQSILYRREDERRNNDLRNETGHEPSNSRNESSEHRSITQNTHEVPYGINSAPNLSFHNKRENNVSSSSESRVRVSEVNVDNNYVTPSQSPEDRISHPSLIHNSSGNSSPTQSYASSNGDVPTCRSNNVIVQNQGAFSQNIAASSVATSTRSVTTSSNSSPRSAASTLEPLGISIEKPRYPQYAVLATRISSFRNWPEHLRQRPEELAKAGFLYEGTNDFTRCFFCAGGLRDWEPEDNPWIEHARWYKNCVFVRQCKGEDFVNLVQQGKIQEAMGKLEGRSNKKIEQIEDVMKSTAALSVQEMGYNVELVRKAIEALSRNQDLQTISADVLLQCVWELEEGGNNDNTGQNNTQPSTYHSTSNENESPSSPTSDNTPESTEALLAENRQLKEQQICKICMDEDISIVFLPCGHMVTCVNCAPAVRKCPLCRRFIKGTVKAILS
ncbi:hypothetical protein FSP39_023359 [Pinctada imbricata]|uniref:RING-type domain-containing protein n=1 Tax=Pinctada imbricata TaxID=66713 RepID=A0AA88YJW2_PINIB|nr:hypothetical protein FSP39_023359 [Pinctada imbricata]